MVQTERRRIRQLQKDRPVMFLLPLLLMLMVIEVIYACHCEEVDWGRVMCPGEKKTVLMGGAISESRVTLPGGSSVTALHTLKLEKTFKEGPFNLTRLSDDTVLMFTPHNCSHAPSDNDTLYIISGDTDAGGILQSSNCTIEPFIGFFEKSGRENFSNIFWRKQSPNC